MGYLEVEVAMARLAIYHTFIYFVTINELLKYILK